MAEVVAAETKQEPPVIELEGVSVASAEDPLVPVLEDIHWHVGSREYWIIGGWPGSGKSDLLIAAAGLIRPLKGMVRFFGRELGRLSGPELLRERLRIGMLFAEGGRPFRSMTVIDNVALALCYHRNCSLEQVADQVNALLDLTELKPLAQHLANRLSRSWQKRVGLARALSFAPEVLFLDNPLVGLDLRQIGWWTGFLAQLAAGHPFFDRRPMTLVAAVDDLRPWLKQGRQFALIKDKRLHLLGGAPELAQSTDPLVRELLADSPQPH